MERSSSKRRLVAIGLGAAVAAVLMAGCGDEFAASRIATGQSEEAGLYANLADAVRAEGNVALRSGVGSNVRVVHEETAETERWVELAADFPVDEVVSNRSGQRLGDHVIVIVGFHFVNADPAKAQREIDDHLASTTATLKKRGPALTILRYSSDRPGVFGQATSQTLFVERDDKVRNPAYPGGRWSDPVADEAMTYGSIKELAEALRTFGTT